MARIVFFVSVKDSGIFLVGKKEEGFFGDAKKDYGIFLAMLKKTNDFFG